jgi:hypothetical protein
VEMISQPMQPPRNFNMEMKDFENDRCAMYI